MSLFSTIVSEASDYENSQTPLSTIAHKYEFNILEPEDTDNPNDYYECFKAEKYDGNQKIVITIITRDIYRSFVNDDDEPYHNKIEVFENDKCIDHFEYTYFK